MVRIAVIGGRDFDDFELLSKCLNILSDRYMYDDIMIVSGQAPGADTLGVDYAKRYGIAYKEYPAEWDNLEAVPCRIKYNRFGKPYNALAGFNRNTTIIENCDVVLAFWNGKSPGTKDSIDKAKALDKEVIEISYESK